MKNLTMTLDKKLILRENDSMIRVAAVDEVVDFKIYPNFLGFLEEHEEYLLDFEGKEIKTEDVFSSSDKFSTYIDGYFFLATPFKVDFEQIHRPILYMVAKDSREATIYFKSIDELNDKNDVLTMINTSLKGCGKNYNCVAVGMTK